MFTEQFKIEFEKSNRRLTQSLLIEHIEYATCYLASKKNNHCISIQPGHSGYAWSERKVIMAFLWKNGENIRIRYIHRNSYRNAEITPACFAELKGFPKGDILNKLTNWSATNDGAKIIIKDLQKLDSLPSEFYSIDSETTKLIFYREYHFENI